MPKIFINRTEFITPLEQVIAHLVNERMEHFGYVFIRKDYDIVVGCSLPHPYILNAALGANVVLKLIELTTPETAIPLVVEIVDPILLIEW